MSADLSRLLKELQDFGVPEQRSCEIAAELIRVGARTVFAQLGEIAGKNEATPWEIALLAAAFIGEPMNIPTLSRRLEACTASRGASWPSNAGPGAIARAEGNDGRYSQAVLSK